MKKAPSERTRQYYYFVGFAHASRQAGRLTNPTELFNFVFSLVGWIDERNPTFPRTLRMFGVGFRTLSTKPIRLFRSSDSRLSLYEPAPP